MNLVTRRMKPAPSPALSTGPLLQRKGDCAGKCGTCGGEEKDKLRRSSHSHAQAGALVPQIVHDVLRSSGEPLDRNMRDYFEPKFGRDFSHVRVHRDSLAAASAHTVDADAYAIGTHIVLSTNASSATLAHELVHTVQQESISAGGDLRVGPPGDEFEQQADRVAESVTRSPGKTGVVHRDAVSTLRRTNLKQTEGVADTKGSPQVDEATIKRGAADKVPAGGAGDLPPDVKPGVCPSPESVGLLPQDPGIASKSRCRGACGADCEPNNCKSIGNITLKIPAKQPQHHHDCVYWNVLRCGTHEGCRFHDSCYDSAADAGETSTSGALHWACDGEAAMVWGVDNGKSWADGGGPFDGYLFFTKDPILSAAVKDTPVSESAGEPGAPK